MHPTRIEILRYESADVAEWVDELVLNTNGQLAVRVRVPSSVLKSSRVSPAFFFRDRRLKILDVESGYGVKVATHALGACAERRVSSNLTIRT